MLYDSGLSRPSLSVTFDNSSYENISFPNDAVHSNIQIYIFNFELLTKFPTLNIRNIK